MHRAAADRVQFSVGVGKIMNRRLLLLQTNTMYEEVWFISQSLVAPVIDIWGLFTRVVWNFAFSSGGIVCLQFENAVYLLYEFYID